MQKFGAIVEESLEELHYRQKLLEIFGEQRTEENLLEVRSHRELTSNENEDEEKLQGH